MDIRFQAGGPDKWKGEVTLIPLSENENILETCPRLAALAPYLEIAPAMCDVHGKKGETALVYGHPKLPMPRVMFVGLGEGAPDPAAIREGFAGAVHRAKALGVASIVIPAFVFDRYADAVRACEEAVFACLVADWKFTTLKRKDASEKPLEWLALADDGEFFPENLRQAARRAESAAEAVTAARELISLPANILYPESFADRAEQMTADLPVSVRIMDEKDLACAGHNAHLAVGRGSARPPRLVILEYAPKDHADEDPLVLIGKGITFDSGGISLKPAAKMHQMKSDMTGAACVLAAVTALAREGVDRRIVGLAALAENMPGGNAVHPGDVVTGASGDTIEIVNTDAEGRLVLCDTLAFACRQWHPRAVIDVATLTGACSVALGDDVAGLFSNSDALASAVAAAADRAGEPVWRLPLWQPYKRKLESPAADICHTATREGGAITAALFLEHFVSEGTPWVHLDIAGVDWVEKNRPLCQEGPTAFSARTLLEFGRGGF